MAVLEKMSSFTCYSLSVNEAVAAVATEYRETSGSGKENVIIHLPTFIKCFNDVGFSYIEDSEKFKHRLN